VIVKAQRSGSFAGVEQRRTTVFADRIADVRHHRRRTGTAMSGCVSTTNCCASTRQVAAGYGPVVLSPTMAAISRSRRQANCTSCPTTESTKLVGRELPVVIPLAGRLQASRSIAMAISTRRVVGIPGGVVLYDPHYQIVNDPVARVDSANATVLDPGGRPSRATTDGTQ